VCTQCLVDFMVVVRKQKGGVAREAVKHCIWSCYASRIVCAVKIKVAKRRVSNGYSSQHKRYI